jgi:prophage DNA circulation protein
MIRLLATPSVNGIFNVVTGVARSIRDLMLAAYAAIGANPRIEYIASTCRSTSERVINTSRKAKSIACRQPVTMGALRSKTPSVPV